MDNSKFTHLSYQMINTLDFSKEQFSNVINHHCNYIENPIDSLKNGEIITIIMLATTIAKEIRSV